MAKTESLVQGRVGDLIFYRVKGKTRIRSMPLVVRNPRTSLQQLVRKRMIAAVRFYRCLKDTPLRNIWRLAARDMPINGYNFFLKWNIHAFSERTLCSPSALSMTCGWLPRMNELRMTGRSGTLVQLAWTNSLESESRADEDRLQVVALFEKRMYSPVWLKGVSACRGDGKAVVDLGRENAGKAHLYCFFSSPDGGAYSASAYLCITLNEKV